MVRAAPRNREGRRVGPVGSLGAVIAVVPRSRRRRGRQQRSQGYCREDNGQKCSHAQSHVCAPYVYTSSVHAVNSLGLPSFGCKRKFCPLSADAVGRWSSSKCCVSRSRSSLPLFCSLRR